jgi:hypothetical protein
MPEASSGSTGRVGCTMARSEDADADADAEVETDADGRHSGGDEPAAGGEAMSGSRSKSGSVTVEAKEGDEAK